MVLKSIKDPTWVTRDGQFVPVSQMSRTHLMYSIAKVKRDRWRKHMLERLELEVRVRNLTRPHELEVDIN